MNKLSRSAGCVFLVALSLSVLGTHGSARAVPGPVSGSVALPGTTGPTPEVLAFVGQGCAADHKDGVAVALFKLNRYLGLTLRLTLTGFQPSQQPNVTLSMGQSPSCSMSQSGLFQPDYPTTTSSTGCHCATFTARESYLAIVSTTFYATQFTYTLAVV